MLWGKNRLNLALVLSSWQENHGWRQRKAHSGTPLGGLSSQGGVPQGHRFVFSVRGDRDASPAWRAEVGSDVDRGDNCRQENIFIACEGGGGERGSIRSQIRDRNCPGWDSIPLILHGFWNTAFKKQEEGNKSILQLAKQTEKVFRFP